jgi:hypothetical protein
VAEQAIFQTENEDFGLVSVNVKNSSVIKDFSYFVTLKIISPRLFPVFFVFRMSSLYCHILFFAKQVNKDFQPHKAFCFCVFEDKI